MATLGNNLLEKNCHPRDEFMTDEESKYNDVLRNQINNGGVEFLSPHNIGLNKLMDIYLRAKIRIVNQEEYFPEQARRLAQVRQLLGLDKKSISENNIVNNYRQIFVIDVEVKNILAEVIMEFVEEGRFDEVEMEFVENQLNVMLGSIVDYHMVSDEVASQNRDELAPFSRWDTSSENKRDYYDFDHVVLNEVLPVGYQNPDSWGVNEYSEDYFDAHTYDDDMEEDFCM